MSRATTADVVVKYSDNGWERARSRLDTLNAGIGKSKNLVISMSKAVAGVASAWAIATNAAINFADNLSKQSQIAGVSLKKYQQLTYAASQYSITQEILTDGLKDLTKNIGDNNPVFEELGIKVKDAQGNFRTTEAVLRDLQDALANMDSPAQRAAYAARTGGEAFQQMSTFLAEGSKKIDTLSAKATELGLVLSDETVKGAQEAKKELSTLTQIVKVNMTNALLTVVPRITELVQELTSDPEKIQRFADVIGDIAVALTVAVEKGVLFMDFVSRALKRRWEDTEKLAKFIEGEKATLAQWEEELSNMDVDDWLTFDFSIKKKQDDIDDLTDSIEKLELQLSLLENPSWFDETNGTDTSGYTATGEDDGEGDGDQIRTPEQEAARKKAKEARLKAAKDLADKKEKIIKNQYLNYQDLRMEWIKKDKQLEEEAIEESKRIGAAYLEYKNKQAKELAEKQNFYINQVGSTMAGYFAATGADSERQKEMFINNLRQMAIQAAFFHGLAALSGGSLVVGSSGQITGAPVAPSGVGSSHTLTQNAPKLESFQNAQQNTLARFDGGSVTNNNNITVNSNSADPKQVSIEVVQAIAKETTKNEINKNNSRPTRR